METDIQRRLEAGARNLLLNCAECRPGQRVLLVSETETDGYYDPDLSAVIDRTAAQLGLTTEHYRVPLLPDVTDPNPELCTRMERADCTVFLARLGDQIRFRPNITDKTQIISYALDRDMLGSAFGTSHYRGFEALSQLINRRIAEAQIIHVTCPEGTDFKGGSVACENVVDVTRKRFPVSVFAPVPAITFAGRIAQRGFLTGTGCHYYSPNSCEITKTLMVNFAGNRITGFTGSSKDVAAARAHYTHVGDTYGLETYYIHSWHAGIHPGCAYPQSAGRDLARWSGGAFGNPRLMHFHTCGSTAPGEISLNVLDPTIRIDGVAVWEDGRLYPERIPGGQDLLGAYPCMAEAFLHPAMDVGQNATGCLSLH